MTRPEDELIRARQREKSRLLAWLLGAFVVLMFAITIAKIGLNR
jgi:cytochrome c oxidase assembly protein Cox11